MIGLLPYLGVGLIGGVFAGFFGVGGGIVLVPALVLALKLDQHTAQGMSLVALLLPVGLLGALTYYKFHPFPLKPAGLLALGIFAGTWVGAVFAQRIPSRTLQIAFGLLLIVTGIKLVWMNVSQS